MARAVKPRPLTLTVTASAEGIPFISNVDFCSPNMADSWGRTFQGVLMLDEAQQPDVMVGVLDSTHNWTRIAKSPFTGGDIVVHVDEKSYDAVVAALQAEISQAEDVDPALLQEDEDAYSDDEDLEDDEASIEDGLEDEEDLDYEADGEEEADDEEDEEFEEDDADFEDEEVDEDEEFEEDDD